MTAQNKIQAGVWAKWWRSPALTQCSYCFVLFFFFFLLLHFSFGYLTVSEAAVFHLRQRNIIISTLTFGPLWPKALCLFQLHLPLFFFLSFFFSVVSLPAYLKRVGKCCLVESISGRYRTAYRWSTHRPLKFRARSFAVFRLDAARTSFSHSLFCVSSPLWFFGFFGFFQKLHSWVAL